MAAVTKPSASSGERHAGGRAQRLRTPRAEPATPSQWTLRYLRCLAEGQLRPATEGRGVRSARDNGWCEPVLEHPDNGRMLLSDYKLSGGHMLFARSGWRVIGHGLTHAGREVLCRHTGPSEEHRPT
jgi:hypothetical protein